MKRILALIDFSDVTPAVVRIARDMASAFNCELMMTHVAESDSDFNDNDVQQDISPQAVAIRSHHREMEILSLAMKKEGINVVTQIVQVNSPRYSVAGKILQELARLSADLIVVGSHGHGRLHQFLVGSVTDTVVRKTACPVLVVPSRPPLAPIAMATRAPGV